MRRQATVRKARFVARAAPSSATLRPSKLRHDQSPPRPGIAQRDEAENAEAVAHQARGGNEEGGALAELAHQNREERLVVVDVGDGAPGDQGQAEARLGGEAVAGSGLGLHGQACTGTVPPVAPSR